MNGLHNESRVCLLTGAGGTLGSALCQAMDRKYLVSAVCRTRLPEVDTQERSFVNPLRQESSGEPTTYVIKADFQDEAQILRVVELTLARFGKIDLLINNAGHYSTGSMVKSQHLLEGAAQVFEINTLLALRLAVTVARLFWHQRHSENIAANRNIINVSSTAGLKVYEAMGQSVYGASKAALNSLTLHMASEFARFGVRANAVAPNSFPQIVPTARVVDEILKLDAGSMSGSIVCVDANESAKR